MANSESFFPRCLDVSDINSDGVCSMLRAFAVSAAVALLRRAVKAEVEGRPNRNKRNFSRSGGSSCKQGASAVAVDADILAAATSVTSRYVSFLQSSKATSAQSPPISTKDIFPDHQPVPCCSGRIFGLACCGRDGADAAVTVGDSDFIAILTASEAAVEEGVGETTEKEEYDRGVATEEASCAAAEQTIEGCFAEGELTLEEAGFALGREDSNSGSHKQEGNEEDKGAVGSVGRAMDVLRVLDEDADPQAAVCLGPANAWVVKPVGLSCGRGVEVVSSLRGLVSACQRLKWKAVVQKYVERPLLVQGYKFDIRQWVLLTSINPFVVWGFDESYVRFSSRPFTMNACSLSDRLVHLCNHSVQKEQDQGVGLRHTAHAGSGGRESAAAAKNGCNRGSCSGAGNQALPSGSQGNMWTADQLRVHLRERFQGRDVFREVVLPRIRSVVVQTLLGIREGLEMKGRGLEWLGFDLMVTEDLRVMLVEVNVSPDVSHSTPVTARLVPAATDDALDLLLDDGEAQARATAAPLPKRLSESSPSASEAEEQFDVKPTSPITPRTEEQAPVKAGIGEKASGPPTCNALVGGQQEGESSRVGKLRWQLWHKGKEESRTALLSLRDKKKAWFEARRKTPRWHGNERGGTLIKDDREMAISLIEGIVKAAAAAAAAASPTATTITNALGHTARIPRPSCPRSRLPPTASSGGPSSSMTAVPGSGPRGSARAAEGSTESCRSSRGADFREKLGDEVDVSSRDRRDVYNLENVQVQQEEEEEDDEL
ncbi:unnamed protein product [Pylaiella littoralis]